MSEVHRVQDAFVQWVGIHKDVPICSNCYNGPTHEHRPSGVYVTDQECFICHSPLQQTQQPRLITEQEIAD